MVDWWNEGTLTMTSISRQCVTVGTDAAERARDVVTAESTLMTHFLTFVDVFAHLHRTRSEPVRTLALEPAFHVGARSVAANIVNGAFVFVYSRWNRISFAWKKKPNFKILKSFIRSSRNRLYFVGNCSSSFKFEWLLFRKIKKN